MGRLRGSWAGLSRFRTCLHIILVRLDFALHARTVCMKKTSAFCVIIQVPRNWWDRQIEEKSRKRIGTLHRNPGISDRLSPLTQNMGSKAHEHLSSIRRLALTFPSVQVPFCRADRNVDSTIIVCISLPSGVIRNVSAFQSHSKRLRHSQGCCLVVAKHLPGAMMVQL